MSATPLLRVPPGACDTHMHIYEARFAFAPTATIKPPPAPVSAYCQMQKQLGLDRVVVVQPSAYGFDNTCTLEAVAALGANSRCVVVTKPEVSDAELKKLHAAGARSVRYFMLQGGVLPWDTLEAMAARIAPLGWNINLQLDGRNLEQYETMLSRLPCTLVIDHNGKFLEPVGIDHPGFRTLRKLLDSGRCYVKLSAPYETSKTGAPKFADVSLLARALVQANPERCLWASNWPHPNQNPQPSNVDMLDLLLDWADNDAVRRKILTDNPARLYGF